MMMKCIILFLFISSLSFAESPYCSQENTGVEEFIEMSTKVIFPDVTDLNLHFLYKNYVMDSSECKKNEVWVQGPKFVENGIDNFGNKTVPSDAVVTEKLGFSFCVDKKKFEEERQRGLSVFQTRVASGTKNEGTSFLVGDNIVMTNFHIAVPLDPNPSDCRGVEITLNSNTPDWVKCKKILYCDKSKDVCFVEMEPPKTAKRLSDLVPKVKLNCAPIKAQKGSVVGNSNAFGIQAGEGKVKDEVINSLQPLGGIFQHHIPTTGGASGSPVFNSSGEVIGINHSHTGKESFVSMNEDKGANRGTSMNYLLRSMKEKINSKIFQVTSPIDNFDRALKKEEEIRNIKKILKEINPSSSNCK